MRLQRQLAAVFLVLLVKLMSSPAQADLIWGVNGHPFTAYPGIAFDQQLDFVKDLGMTSYRVNISSITQTSRLGRLIEFAKPRGIDILPVLTPGSHPEPRPRKKLNGRPLSLVARLCSVSRVAVQGRYPRLGAGQ